MPKRDARPAASTSRWTKCPKRAAAFLGRHRVLLLLLLADVATKIAAYSFLPEGEVLPLLPGIRLYLAINEWGVMGGEHGIGAVAANPSYTMLLALGLLLFAVAIVRLGASELGFGARVAVGSAVFLAVAFSAQTIAAPLAHREIPVDIIVPSIRAAVLMVTLAFYSVSRSRLPRAAFTLLAAGALANSASYAYPPFEVVDFLMIPLQPLLALLGRGADIGEQASGVINLADVYLFTFPLLLAAWPAHAVFTRFRRKAAA